MAVTSVIGKQIINVDNELAFKIKNGCKVPNEWQIKDKVIFKNNEKLLGIYEIDNRELKVWKNFT